MIAVKENSIKTNVKLLSLVNEAGYHARVEQSEQKKKEIAACNAATYILRHKVLFSDRLCKAAADMMKDLIPVNVFLSVAESEA